MPAEEDPAAMECREPSDSPQQFCLRWNNYQSNLTSSFDQLLQTQSFVDVTLSCDGQSLKAHKVVLSACSPYFQSLFMDNPCQHPIIIMRDTKYCDLKAAVDFMYRGEINVSQEQIPALLKVAESLKIRGLTDVSGDHAVVQPGRGVKRSERAERREDSPPKTRRRLSEDRASVSSSRAPPPTPSPTPAADLLPPPEPAAPAMPAMPPLHPDDVDIRPGIAEMIREEERILIALAFYATGSYQTLVGQSALHNASQKTVSRAVRQVTEALNHNTIFKKYVKWPMQISERNAIKAKFYEKFGWPCVLGCIDGTLVAIIRPTEHEERYYNRKGYHSLNVMIICDSDLNILAMDASNPGSAHDSSVWQNHPLNQHLIELSTNGEQGFLLGDSGYPLRKTMQTPILNTVEGTPQHHFYTKHVHARNTVERCIGVLKARFRCLLVARSLHYSPITAGKIVNACCVLHNIAITINAPVPRLSPEEAHLELLILQQDEAELDRLMVEQPQNQPRRVNPDLLEGRILQQALVDKLWRDAH